MFKRFRTSRGFGVHSPLAFSFITGPMRDVDARYYATASLPGAAARRWLRVAVWAGSPRVWRLGGECPGLDSALRAAGAAASGPGAPLIAAVRLEELIALPAAATVMLIDTDPAMLARLAGPLTSGALTFSHAREHYILMRPDLPRQHFDITMR